MTAIIEDEIWRVVSAGGKRLFEGLENDARKFIVDHFPRLHVVANVTPKPDAVLVAPGGNADTCEGTTHYDGTQFVNPDGTPAAPAASSAPTVSGLEADVKNDVLAAIADLKNEFENRITELEGKSNGNA